MLATAKGYYDGTQIVLEQPVQFQTGQEVIVTYTIINSSPNKENKDYLVDSLVGAIPNSGKTLEEYRSERLKKYESIDWYKRYTWCTLNRDTFVQTAVEILKIPEENVQKFVSASAITDIYYIAYQEIRDKAKVKDLLKTLLQIIHVADVSEKNIQSALNSDWSDFEDSVQNSVAESHGYDTIITRNKGDYRKSTLQIFSPKEFLEEIKNNTI